ncbi:MAG: D-alanyl-D-alanine carboxypeptidase family protein [Alphaproteobacteria bacterium]|jgi:serine-type D-ala-D-ala carboxypeptidase|nr:serine-type D-Ala-D-Ala carboxypeptidase [Azospirillum sp. CAG:239]
MMFGRKKLYSSVLTAGLVLAGIGSAAAIETQARNAILMDYDTGQYLYVKDHEKMVPPASMSKLMTVNMIFEKLKDGSLSLDDTFTVSERAWKLGGAASGGSTMFLKIGEKVRVEDILKGILIQSGNDACIVAAENLAGSEDDFAEMMNKRARELGLNNSSFANSTGLPHPDQKMSVEDLAKLARHIIKEFPEFYHIFSEKYYTHNNITQGNRNPLLYSMPNADGLKTGHTEEAGFCLTASAKKGERRLIEVMTGMNSNKERSEEAERLMEWGFREFNNYNLLNKGQEIAEIPVVFGNEKEVRLVVPETVKRTLKKSQASKIKMTAVYDKPVKAPVAAGDKLGEVRIELDGQEMENVPLVADRNIEKLGFFGRIGQNLKYLLFGAE